MATGAAIDLGSISRALGIPTHAVETVVELLDLGNTIPFITRYRKDQTGGLDEEQIRTIETKVLKRRVLLERKQTIVRSIDSQGRLTPELAAAIEAADTQRRLEDLYLPFKPKKQTLATTARDRGLEPLAVEILAAAESCADLDARARDFVNPDRHVHSAADSLLGAGHILAEQFGERADLRGRLRGVLEKSGKLVSTAAQPEPTSAATSAPAAGDAAPPDDTATGSLATQTAQSTDGPGQTETVEADAAGESLEEPPAVTPDTNPISVEASSGQPATGIDVQHAIDSDLSPALESSAANADPASDGLLASIGDNAHGASESASHAATVEPSNLSEPTSSSADPLCTSAGDPDAPDAELVAVGVAADVQPPSGDTSQESAPAPLAAPALSKYVAPAISKKKKEKSKKDLLHERQQRAFRDYFKYSESITKIPPHRVLAINRGEREKVLRVKLEYDVEAVQQVSDELLIPADHAHAEFLRGCARDALARLVLPSLERELRREMTERAELHAVGVFARNLRNLLLAPPVRERRVLAIDPGFKSGCKLAALDEFGNLLDQAVAHLVGSAERRAESTRKLAELVRTHGIQVIAIGNGTGCRDTERWISDLIAGELAELQVAYVIVNEAGASVYSTSRIGREEFPKYDATLRGAISIGRRLLDPLSELVKIDPANIGVGMYQHDVKAKHLRDSLDGVVASCVNFVGVDLNTASPALLRYVSGLNQLTAQRVYEHRIANGPFRNRDSLKSVQGVGEATFVQAAGFLKIVGGDNPLDTTWIHPESYANANQVLAKLDASPADLTDKPKAAQLAERAGAAAVEQLAGEVQVGVHTLSDILAQLARPGRDPRETLPPPIFKKGILKLDDLAPGMELAGTVLNVVDFGAFVDIGLKDSGLVHISQLANRFVQDPHTVVSVGDVVRVWVVEVDKERRRVSLSMIDPAARQQRSEQKRGGDQKRGGQRDGRPRRGRRPPVATPADGAAASAVPPATPASAASSDGQSTRQSKPPFKRRGAPGNRPFDSKRSKSRDSEPAARPPVKPKVEPPAKPLTKAMKEGRAPLRTFGDLKQFWTLKQAEQQTEEPTGEPS